jgi:hypothetical protein
MMVRYFVLFLDPFPTLMMVMTITSGASIYFLGKFDMKRNGVQDGRRSIQEFKRFFTSSKMLVMILASVLVLDSFVSVLPDTHWISSGSPTNDFYCGVTFGGNTTAEAKLLIDRIKNFTNVFVVDSWPISQNEAALNEICNYAIDSGLYVIVYFAYFSSAYYWQASWLDTARQRWGEKFLGVYLYDEPGGIQLDENRLIGGNVLSNYGAAANNYTRYTLKLSLRIMPFTGLTMKLDMTWSLRSLVGTIVDN